MAPDVLLALVAFAFVTSITPGPNNLMLLASGLNFGVRRTVPHMLGIGIGFTVLVVAVGLGLSGVFRAAPVLYEVLKWMGAAYMLWLAWRIARSGPVSTDPDTRGHPMSFLGAAAFQWVNPKAWVMAVTAIATYGTPGSSTSIVLIAVVFGLVNLPSVSLWAAFGAGLRRVLSDARHVTMFNRTMAALLVLSLWPLVSDALG